MRRRRQPHPLTRLAIAMRVAAREIDKPIFRRQAAREAESIPVCNAERGGGKKGEMARLGRITLASLADADPETFPDKAMVLRGCADAITSRFEVTSEISLGDRRRKPKAA